MLDVGTIVFGHFEILHTFERSAQDGVFLARHLDFPDKRCTLKVMKLTESSIEDLSAKRFRNEILVTYELQHPNIIRSRGYHREGQLIGLEMEYLSLGNLRDLIKSGQEVSPGQVIYLLGEVLHGLSIIHQNGIIHRDMRPENILFGEKNATKITDFGAARVGATISTGQGITGMLEYLSPEYVKDGTLTEASDIYSLGICAYELVAGKKPYKADSPIRALAQRLTEKITPPHELNTNCPEALSDIIVRAMDNEPEKRYSSAKDMFQALNNFSVQSGIHPEPLSPNNPPVIPGAQSTPQEKIASESAVNNAVTEKRPKRKSLTSGGKKSAKLVNKAFGRQSKEGKVSSGIFSKLAKLVVSLGLISALALLTVYFVKPELLGYKNGSSKKTTKNSAANSNPRSDLAFIKAPIPIGWYVEYLSSSRLIEAADHAAKLEEHGFPLELQTILGEEIQFKVFIGPFSSKEEVNISVGDLQRTQLFRRDVKLFDNTKGQG